MSSTSFHCHLCSHWPKFKKKFNLDRHIASKHKKPKFFECTECDSRFTRQDTLKSHIKCRHTDNQPVFECAECSVRCTRKETLKLHITRYHSDNPPVFECTECSSSFARQDGLKSHIKRRHTDNQPVFECAECCLRYTSKEKLKLHITSCHSDNRPVFECTKCDSRFTRQDTLKSHIKRRHTDNQPVFECAECSVRCTRKETLKLHITRYHSDNPPVFECTECSSSFARQDSLKSHIKRRHTDNQPVFECAHCSKKFVLKFCLREHITTVHRNAHEPNDQFECLHCSSTFSKLSYLRRHIQRVHVEGKQNIKESRLTCLKCSRTFRTSMLLYRHYVDAHDVVLNYEELEFDSIESFEKWLETHQHRTVTQFSKQHKRTNAAYTIQRFTCHRSGHIRSSLTVDSRKRQLKTSGYKPLGGICPAEIRLHIRENGSCSVKYQTTHVGHKIGDVDELKHIYLTREEKKNIAAEIQSGIPLSQIVKRTRLSNTGKDINRLSLVTRVDVRNIAASQKLAFENREYVEPGCDPVDVELIIEKHKDDILFYKRQNEEDSRFRLLEEEDFALVIMTARQETYLRSYGHKVICIDGTHGTNPYGFLLHTLMVLDTDYEGLAGAFLITNRNDVSVVDILLACVHDRIGTLQPQTIMTDTQLTYWNSWVKIMNVPRYGLFCTWHVSDAWRKNFSKIADKKKRKDVQDELKRLRCEMDQVKFENGLGDFLSRRDDELIDFQNYFEENYGRNKQRWAYCYRIAAGANTNMSIEAFHRSLKYIIAGGQKIQTLTQGLSFIFEYLILLESKMMEKKIRGKITNKLDILRRRHKKALEYDLSDAIAVNDDTYIVMSSQTDFHTISKCEYKECDREGEKCRLHCDRCDICFHTFTCTCIDSSIRSNMCKHIHLVGLYLRNKRPELDANRSQSNDGVDVPVSYLANNESSSSIAMEDVVQNRADDEVSFNTRKKQKLIQQIESSYQRLRENFETVGVYKLKQIYARIKKAALESDVSE